MTSHALRLQVLRVDGCGTEGGAFSLHSFTCSVAFPCKVSMWVLGSPWQGFSEGFPGNHIWTAAGDKSEKVASPTNVLNSKHLRQAQTGIPWTPWRYTTWRLWPLFCWESYLQASACDRLAGPSKFLEIVTPSLSSCWDS